MILVLPLVSSLKWGHLRVKYLKNIDKINKVWYGHLSQICAIRKDFCFVRLTQVSRKETELFFFNQLVNLKSKECQNLDLWWHRFWETDFKINHIYIQSVHGQFSPTSKSEAKLSMFWCLSNHMSKNTHEGQRMWCFSI